MLVAFIKAGTNSHVHQSVNMEDTWYFSRDLLLPLQDLPGFDEVMDRMNPNLNYVWKDGNVYSISWYSGPRVMFYNGQRVREAGLDPENPPETYSEFLEWAEALTDDTHWFINLWSQEEWWRWQFMGYPFYIAATGTNQLVSEDGTKAIFNTPEALQSYELIDTLFAEGYNLTEAMEGNPFLSGQVAATLGGADQSGYGQAQRAGRLRADRRSGTQARRLHRRRLPHLQLRAQLRAHARAGAGGCGSRCGQSRQLGSS